MKQFLTLIALFATICTFAQNAEITGIVTDQSTKEPIAGAIIKYERGKGVASNENGQYKLSLPEGQYEISYSFMGYKRDKKQVILKAGEKMTANMELKPEAFSFNEIVSVSQYKKNQAKENVSTAVVTSENLQHTNANDLGTALNTTSGVLVQDGQVTIRGGGSYSYGVGQRTSINQDGLSLMSADLGQGQGNMVELSNAKQIEVIKGASSVIYGSSALNGVVNVITDWPTEDTPRTYFDINTGVYGNTPHSYQNWWDNALPYFVNINVNHRRKIKNLQFMTGGNITGKDSYLQDDNNWRVQMFFKTREISQKIEGLSYGFNGSFQYETIEEFFISKDADTNAFRSAANSSSRYFRLNVDPHVTYFSPKGHNYKLRMRYMNIDRIGNGTDPNAVSHQIMVDNQYQYKWKNMFVVTIGAPFTWGRSRSNLYNDIHYTFAGAGYAQLEFNYKRLSIQAGLRYEIQKVDADLEKGLPVFRSGINYQAGKATFIRGSWGQGYRIPAIGERDILQNFYSGVLVLPNDTLHSEKSWHLEVGVNQGFKIGKKFLGFVDLAIFYDQYSEFTQYDFGFFPNRFPGSGAVMTTDTGFLNHLYFPVYQPNTTPLSQLQLFGVQAHNLVNAHIFGYEFSFGGRGQIGPVGLTFGGGYSYNFGSQFSPGYGVSNFMSDAFKYMVHRVQDTSSATYHNLLEFRARHQFKLDLELKYWKVYIGTTIVYGSFPEVIPNAIGTATSIIAGNDSYTRYYNDHKWGDVVADLRAGYKVNKHTELGFIVKNVGNRFYMLRPGRPEPIRNYTIQFRYNF